ncbi:unnamed protein product [Phaeothamnion confervicola]
MEQNSPNSPNDKLYGHISDSPSTNPAETDPVAEVAYDAAETARVVAAARAIETELEDGVINDPFARVLAGETQITLMRNLLTARSSTKGHLISAARARIVDDMVMEEAAFLLQSTGADSIQVVNLGSGMDTRPWRLESPTAACCCWFEVDVPEMLQLKASLLAQHFSGGSASGSTGDSCGGGGSSGGDGGGGDGGSEIGGGGPPIKVKSFTAIPLDLRETHRLNASLCSVGFEPAAPTVWIMEGLLYYMPLDAVLTLLRTLAHSAPAAAAAAGGEDAAAAAAAAVVVVAAAAAAPHVAICSIINEQCLLNAKTAVESAKWKETRNNASAMMELWTLSYERLKAARAFGGDDWPADGGSDAVAGSGGSEMENAAPAPGTGWRMRCGPQDIVGTAAERYGVQISRATASDSAAELLVTLDRL